MEKEIKRHEFSKYGFAQMNVGDEKNIEVSGIIAYQAYTRLKSACRAEEKRFKSKWVTRRTETHIYYKRTA